MIQSFILNVYGENCCNECSIIKLGKKRNRWKSIQTKNLCIELKQYSMLINIRSVCMVGSMVRGKGRGISSVVMAIKALNVKMLNF